MMFFSGVYILELRYEKITVKIYVKKEKQLVYEDIMI